MPSWANEYVYHPAAFFSNFTPASVQRYYPSSGLPMLNKIKSFQGSEIRISHELGLLHGPCNDVGVPYRSPAGGKKSPDYSLLKSYGYLELFEVLTRPVCVIAGAPSRGADSPG